MPQRRRTFSTRPLTNTHDWPAASASEATALRRYTNLIIIIIIIIIMYTHVIQMPNFTAVQQRWYTDSFREM